MTPQEAIEEMKEEFEMFKECLSSTDLQNPNPELKRVLEANDMAIKSIEVLDKLESIIVDQLDKSDDQKECMTLRWVLDKIAEVRE